MREKGFSLVELLVVVAIITILATIGISSFTSLQKNSRDAKRKSDLSIIQSSLEQYRADQGYYPASLTFGGSLKSPSGTRTYIGEIPLDVQIPDPGDDKQYHYVPSPPSCDNSQTDKNCTSYCLDANLENPSEAVSSCSGDGNRNYKVSPP